MKDTFQREQACRNLGKEGAQRHFIGHIDLGQLYGDTLCGKAVNRLLLRSGGDAPSPRQQ